MVDPDNIEAITAWNTVLFDKFLRYRTQVSRGLTVHGERAITSLLPRAGARVVDLGCGFGDTALELARRVGPTGSVVGVDAAERYLDIARTEIGALANLRYEALDLETRAPDGPFDLAFSRFGTMFFARPVIALRNIRRALVPGGRLAMTVWRAKTANECFHLAEDAVRRVVGDPPKGDHITCGPGPFSMASADVVTDQLLSAGFTDVSLARSDAPLCLGATIAEAIELALELGPAGEVARLAGLRAQRDQVEVALAEIFRALLGDSGVVARSSAWIVTATA